MTLPAPTYDLMLLLDPQVDESTRTKIVADAVKSIQSQGELLNQADWGERQLAYPIDRKASAEYHLLQFHAGEAALLEGLDRTLHITDAVLRHRIIKLAPGTPDAPEMTAQRRSETAEADAGQPAAVQPAAVQPAAAQPAAAEPAATEADAPAPAAQAEPAVAEPDAPETAEPAAAETPAPEQPAAEQAPAEAPAAEPAPESA